MKHKVSITMDQETILAINDKMRDGWFRSKSHFIEWAIKKVLEDRE
ncbi:hypothetical protein ACFL1H_06655 [Nanoarchaeota archaeon]